MKSPPRYRARMEWFGVELFDRVDGRVIPVEDAGEDVILNRDTAPVIDTPYPKTPAFASAPRRIYWELTRKCNLDCKACFNRSESGLPELTTPDILDIAGRIYRAGVYEIRLTGGEPTLRQDFFEIVETLNKMGFYLSMGTNGVYGSNTMECVTRASIHWIILSLDGADAARHDDIRGEGRFQSTMKTIEKLAAQDRRIRINTLIRKSNHTYEDLKGLAAICDRYGAESLNCIPLRPVTNDPGIIRQQLSAGEFKTFIKALNRLRQEFSTDFVTTLDLRHTQSHDRIYEKDRSCAAGREGAVISPHGEIYGCSYSPASVPDAPPALRKPYVAGNLLEEDFLEIWNNSGVWAIYRDLEKYKHHRCKKCPYYLERRCIGSCPIMDPNDPGAFDPYCYLHIQE